MPIPSTIIQSVELMPLAPTSEITAYIEERAAAAAPPPDQYKVSQLIGNDNWQKSFFYRSFRAKAAQSASIAVMRYDGDGTPVYVTDYPEEHRFIVSFVTMQRAENVQIMQTFGEDLDIIQTFGSQPMIWQFRGSLRNEMRDPRRVRVWQDDGSYADVEAGDGDWRNGFVDAYNSHMRASQLVRRGHFLEFTVGDMLIYGYVIGLTIQEAGAHDTMVEFTMDFFVRDVSFPQQTLTSIESQLAKIESTDPS